MKTCKLEIYQRILKQLSIGYQTYSIRICIDGQQHILVCCNGTTKIGEEVHRIATAGISIDPVLSETIALSELLERAHFYCKRFKTSIIDAPERKIFASEIGVSRLNMHSKFDVDDWVAGTSLITNEEFWVPFEGFRASRRYYRSTTSGWAAHIDDRSISNALLEIVERDAILTAWYDKNMGIKINTNSIIVSEGDPIEIAFYLINSSIDVYTVIAKSTSDSNSIYLSSGCSTQLKKAIEKSLMGVAQKICFRNGFSEICSKTAPSGPNEHRKHYSSENNRKYLNELFESLPVYEAEINPTDNAKDDADLDFLCRLLRKKKLNCIYVDETFDALQNEELNVARVVIPDLIPLTFGPDSEARIPKNPAKLPENLRLSKNHYHPFI